MEIYQHLFSYKKCKQFVPQETKLIFSTYRLTSILLSHFILDLRSIHYTHNSTSQLSDESTTLRFATSIQGNLGASLDGSWATGQERDIEEDIEIQYSNNPLATGLLSFERDSHVERLEENSGSITEAG